MSALTDLIERLRDAEMALLDLAMRPTNTLFEQERLTAKATGVRLALSYAEEALRVGGAA